MAPVEFEAVSKVFPDGTAAVLDLNLKVADGELLILVGPSGCGKTTTLRMLAGFEEISAGRITIGNRVAHRLTPRDRSVAMVFQNYALYPHMTAEENIAFPLKMRRELPKKEIVGRVREVARLLGIVDQLTKKPHELSGGQRQRIAMGRAIVREPDAFLMDEPLSNLDAKLRVRMRAELARLHERLGVTTVYVTHDQTEALTLGHRVAVMRDGVLQQVAPPQELYERPANTFVADFIGSPAMNFLEGQVAGGHLMIGGARCALPSRMRALAATERLVLVGIRPEHLRFGGGGRESDGPGLVADVEVIESVGPELFVYLKIDGTPAVDVGERHAELAGVCVARMERGAANGLAPGARLPITITSEEVQLFDRASGIAL